VIDVRSLDGEIWWPYYVYRCKTQGGTELLIVHLVQPPPGERITPPLELPPPLENVQVRYPLTPTKKVTCVWHLVARYSLRAEVLPLSAGDETVSITVPKLNQWAILVVELGSRY